MGWLTTAKSGVTEQVPASLEERLVWLCRFGKPAVRKSGVTDGWVANIEMNTNTTGSKFEVSSGHDCASPSAAVAELISRMLEALTALGAK